MSRILFLDLETYSETPISAGTHRYAQSAEIIVFAYAIDGAPAVAEDFDPVKAQRLVDDAERIVIHNSAFDRTVLGHNDVLVPLEKTHDTMAMALAHSLPGSLGALCELLKVPSSETKADGKKLIHLFCKPRPAKQRLRRATHWTHPDEWERFLDYARLDVEACREVYKRLPRWNASALERAVWMLDQEINERGVAVDTDLVQGAQICVRKLTDVRAGQAIDATGGALSAATERDAVLAYLRTVCGVFLPDLRGPTVDKALSSDLPAEAREILLNRVDATTTSTAKYAALARAVSDDGRLRGTLQYCGASRTGRWAGRLFQPQNLPRGSMSRAEIDVAIEAFKTDTADVVLPDLMGAASACLRGCLVAPRGRKLVVADLSNIEGRVLAWLAGEQWKIDAFAAFDRGDGPDLYKLAYAKAFHKDPADVTKDERQIGKVMELACGFGGGHKAFAAMGAIYGLTVDEAKARSLVQAWRRAHPETVAFWRQAEQAASDATIAPGAPMDCRRVQIVRDGAWLRAVLPSGRSLCYPSPRLTSGRLSYMGVNQYTRKWERLDTWAGRIAENLTQAVARDVLAQGMLAADQSGYKVVLSVHDELLTETPDDPAYTAERLAALMASPLDWAEGLPLAAAGFEAYRYRKD